MPHDSMARYPGQLQPPAGSFLLAQEVRRIRALVQGGKLDLAESAAHVLRNKYPNAADSNYTLARVLAARSKEKYAIPFAQAAVKLGPERVEYLIFLASLYLAFTLFELAGPLLQKAHSLAPNDFIPNKALANYYFDVSNGRMAIGYFKRALGSAQAGAQYEQTLYSYGICALSNGEIGEAEKTFHELTARPGYRIAALVQLALMAKSSSDSELAGLIRAELLSPGLTNEDRSLLNLALGRLEENSGNYDAAFEAFALSRLIAPVHFDTAGHHRTIDEIISFYPKALFDSVGKSGNASELPVFVVGMLRSGTTLTEQIIAAHPDATGVGELPRTPQLALAMRNQYGGAISQGRLIDAARRGEMKERGTADLNCMLAVASAPSAKRIVDKQPANFMSLGYIHLCFPNARIVHCRRNPADCFISSFQTWLDDRDSYAYGQESYAAYYLEKERIMEHWKSCFAENIFDLDYEKLVEEPERVTRELIDFLGLPWDDRCLRYFENNSSVMTPSSAQVRQPIFKSSMGRWRRYEKQLQPLVNALKAGGIEV